MLNDQLDWEKTDQIRGLKHLAAMFRMLFQLQYVLIPTQLNFVYSTTSFNIALHPVSSWFQSDMKALLQ